MIKKDMLSFKNNYRDELTAIHTGDVSNDSKGKVYDSNALWDPRKGPPDKPPIAIETRKSMRAELRLFITDPDEYHKREAEKERAEEEGNS